MLHQARTHAAVVGAEGVYRRCVEDGSTCRRHLSRRHARSAGRVMWAKFVYREIVPPERLVWAHSFSDETGGLTRHPLSPTWPLELLTTVTFEDEPDGKTKLTLRWSPLNATAEEQKTFDASHDGMTQGWNGSFERLAAYLPTTK
jgi:uncharacterized protein YndB with AHSA1/START domain